MGNASGARSVLQAHNSTRTEKGGTPGHEAAFGVRHSRSTSAIDFIQPSRGGMPQPRQFSFSKIFYFLILRIFEKLT